MKDTVDGTVENLSQHDHMRGETTAHAPSRSSTPSRAPNTPSREGIVSRQSMAAHVQYGKGTSAYVAAYPLHQYDSR